MPAVAMQRGVWVTPESYHRFSNRFHHALASVSTSSSRSSVRGNVRGQTQAEPIKSWIMWSSVSRSKGLSR